MKRLMLVAGIVFVAKLGYGTAPWCGVDNGGQLYCSFYSYASCEQAVRNGAFEDCVPNPNR